MSHHRSRSSSTHSEGEIVEPGPEMKATASKPPSKGTSIDRPTRDSPPSAPLSPPSLDGASSPRRRRSPRPRSRSPYRDNRSSKRRRDDDYEYERYESRHPRPELSRNYGPRYDDRNRVRSPDRRPKYYYDYDRDDSHGGGLRYSDDYDRRQDKRPRTRSRSPYRESRKAKKYSGDELDQKVDGVVPSADSGRHRPTEQVLSERGKASVARDFKLGAETRENQEQASKFQASVADEEHPNPETVDSQQAEPVDEAAELEARRKRREAIRAKYRSQATPLHLRAVENIGEGETDTSTPGTEPTSAKETSDSPSRTPLEQQVDLPDFSLGNDVDLANSKAPVNGADEDEPSAADYDPTLDMKEEREKHSNVQINKDDVSSAAYDETQTAKQDVLIPDSKDDAYDMFGDDDDMFAEDAPPAHASAMSAVPQGKELDVSMMDNWDDSEGYYNVRLGELINGRYHVTQNLGKGMFSAVVRATDTKTGNLVAVKIIRQNETMRKAGMKEIDILEQLTAADPEHKKHIIKFERHFEHKGHLCMVFENLSMDLREILKKFGRDVGLNLRAIRAYAQQIFLGLSLLRKCNILHADLKPDNLLVNEQRNILKVCDLGSASPASENEITPYLVSRFYRAPEIILGIPYDFAIDVWSIGCTLFELYTGKILFTGRNNNQMLRSIMECRGKYPPKLLRRGTLAPQHFDDMLNFHSVEEDKITGRLVTKMVDFKKPTRDLKTRLMSQGTRGMSDMDAKDLTLFVDFLDRCLSLNPEKRITPADALKHPFLTRKV